MNPNPAQRTLRRRMLIAAAVYVLAVTLGAFALRPAHALPGLPWLLAIAAGLPAAAWFWILGDYLRTETDEYLRLLESRKSLVATGFALSIATIYGFLELYQLVPHAPVFLIAPLWFLGLVPGSLYNRFGRQPMTGNPA